MVVGTHRQTQIIIDQQAIAQNIINAKEHALNNPDIFVVVKANGYGHGAVRVAQIARDSGATGFCVAILDEALELRNAGITEPILVLGISNPDEIQLAAINNVSLTVGSISGLLTVINSDVRQPVKVHLALDTGMGRIGFTNQAELKQALAIIAANDQVTLEGIFTHFATADEEDETYFQKQIIKFSELMAVVKEKPRYVHVANSATSLWKTVPGVNMIRLGIATYGLNPSGKAILDLPYQLKPALSLKTTVVHVKQIEPGTAISYGATYNATTSEWIATLPIGYADGMLRKLQGFKVLVNGQPCEIVGRICMDQLMIRLPQEVNVGTQVTIIGNDGEYTNTVEDLAEYCETINYEIICGLTNRITRIYE